MRVFACVLAISLLAYYNMFFDGFAGAIQIGFFAACAGIALIQDLNEIVR